jgi:hypothetical protein
MKLITIDLVIVLTILYIVNKFNLNSIFLKYLVKGNFQLTYYMFNTYDTKV